MLEFFLIASVRNNSSSKYINGPKRISKLLATISGFSNLPPFFTLGYHYSKWEETSAQKILYHNE